LTGTAVGPLARAAFVLTEPDLSGVAIVGHRTLREGASFVGVDEDTTGGRERQNGTKQKASHDQRTITPPWQPRVALVYTSRMRTSLACMLAAAVACGPMAGHEDIKNPSGTGSGSAGSAAASPSDATIEISPATEIKGLVFEPDAMYLPSWMLYEPKNRKITLDKQREALAKAKDAVQKEAQAAVLATMLYEKAKGESDEAKKKELYTEARQALRDVAQSSGDKVDDVTLQLLGRYELLLDDYASSEKAWSQLVTMLPKDPNAHLNRAWWAYTLLRQYKNADALAAVGTDPLTEKHPELAYVTAWARFRTGDHAGAWQAILVAAKGWGSNPGRELVDRDVYLFAGRTETPFETAIQQMSPIYVAKGGPDLQYEMFSKLGLSAYQFAGRWADGVKALDKALAVTGIKVPDKDTPVIRYQQADYTVRLDDPATSAKLAVEALDALPKCGSCKPQDLENVSESVYVMARLFHILYATANDNRFYQPAHDLYAAALPKINEQKVKTQGESDSGLLEGTKHAMATKPNAGTHDKSAIGALLSRHNQEVQACYELALGGNPKLGGNLVLMLEADQTGVVKGASSEPKAGLADMAAVAGCVVEHAKQWHLPKVPHPFTTRIKMTFAFSVRKPAPAGGGAGPAAAHP
jgi:hypothetical protein